MYRSAFMCKTPTVAKIDDVLARDAKKASGLAGGNQLWRPFHDRRLARNTKNTTIPKLAFPTCGQTVTLKLVSR
jgi:hypothetical protein